MVKESIARSRRVQMFPFADHDRVASVMSIAASYISYFSFHYMMTSQTFLTFRYSVFDAKISILSVMKGLRFCLRQIGPICLRLRQIYLGQLRLTYLSQTGAGMSGTVTTVSNSQNRSYIRQID